MDHPTPLPWRPVEGRTYVVKPNTRVYIRSPRSDKSTHWVTAVVKHWDESSQTWRVQVNQPHLIETDWMASLIEDRWKMRRKFTGKEQDKRG